MELSVGCGQLYASASTHKPPRSLEGKYDINEDEERNNPLESEGNTVSPLIRAAEEPT
jgi:hypothetical protein